MKYTKKIEKTTKYEAVITVDMLRKAFDLPKDTEFVVETSYSYSSYEDVDITDSEKKGITARYTRYTDDTEEGESDASTV